MVFSPQVKSINENQPSLASLSLVLLAHVAILYSLVSVNKTLPIAKETLSPMMVSLINSTSQEKAVESEFKPAIKPPPSISKKPAKTEAVMTSPEAEAKVKQSAEVSAEKAAATADSEKIEQSNPVSDVKHETEPAKSPAKEFAVEPPKFGAAYLNNPAPDYPAASRRFGEQGVVLLRVLVSISGMAESIQIENGSGYNRLDQAAIKAVQMWSFIPAKRNNQPQSAYVLVPIKFSLAT
jgi:protein TonB